MRICVIFNPSARGEKARRFRQCLDEIAHQATLKLTKAPGDARRLGGEAIAEGFDTIVAAGGDGTVNEVLNGLADGPHGLESVRLALLPLGTVNVFARELLIPMKLRSAWETILRGNETEIDLPRAEFASGGLTVKRYFAQLAGAGLDARAVELVAWQLKKKIGPFAYVLAGLKALAGAPSRITVTAGHHSATGGLVLIGNGRLYGGPFRIFPRADLRDGLLDVCVFPRVNWFMLARCGPQLLVRGTLPAAAATSFQARTISLKASGPTPLEADGELVGHLPATFSLGQQRLRVIVP